MATQQKDVFPGTLEEQALWFSNPRNGELYFLQYQGGPDSTQFWQPLQELIATVVGFETASAFESFFQEQLARTKYGQPYSPVINPSEKITLVNTLCSAMNQRQAKPRARDYMTWLRAAIDTYLPRAIRLSKRRSRESKRGKYGLGEGSQSLVEVLESSSFGGSLEFCSPSGRYKLSNYLKGDPCTQEQLSKLIVEISGFASASMLTELCSLQVSTFGSLGYAELTAAHGWFPLPYSFTIFRITRH